MGHICATSLTASQPNALLVFLSGLLGATFYAFADRMGLFRGISTAVVPKEDKVSKALGVSYAASATMVGSALVALIAVRVSVTTICTQTDAPCAYTNIYCALELTLTTRRR